MECEICGSAVTGMGKYCSVCGHKIKNKIEVNSIPPITLKDGRKLCPVCNSINPSDAHFCGKCGHIFSSPVSIYPPTEPNDETGDGTGPIKVTFPPDTEQKCAILLLLDTSGSMNDSDKIGQLNLGIQIFKQEILKDKLASRRIDVCVMTFDDTVKVVHPFSSILEFNPTSLSANGKTEMGHAINTALDLVEKRKDYYRAYGISYYRPWIFMITDGDPTDMQRGDSLWEKVTKKLNDFEMMNKLMFFCVGIRPANINLLREFMPNSREPLMLKPGDDSFQKMFTWLSNSQTAIANVRTGDQVRLEAPTGWAEIMIKGE